VEVKTETDGIVQEILFEEGQEVKAGELLVKLDETKFKAELEEAQARLQLGRADFERARELYDQQLVSRQEFDQAQSMFSMQQAAVELRQRQLRDARVVAPFAGQTGARNVSPGQVIQRSTVLTWVVDLDPVKVEVDVPERFLGQLRTGQRIQFQVAAYPGKTFEGEVYFIAPRLDLRTRTALVKTRLPNPDGVLKAGMVASLQLQLRVKDDAIMVPEAALISNGDEYAVFVVGPDETAVMRTVTIGERIPRWSEVVSGLEAGERVVVEGHQKIAPGMKLALAPKEKSAIYQTLEFQTPEKTNSAPDTDTSAN
jgi:membrane fusion protein (multidrug efflux system)